MRFLSCHLSCLPFYPQVLSRLRASPDNGFLDAGCCVGQELRHLVYAASIPPSQLYGFDLEPEFFKLGYKLFRDNADSFPATFVGADLGVSDKEWEVGETTLKMRNKASFMDDNARIIWWCAPRVE